MDLMRVKYLNFHRESNHNQKIRYNCNLCAYKYAWPQNVGYPCEECEVTKCSKDFVANHITKSHGEDVYEVIEFADARNVLQCDECSFVARGILPLKCHEENTHQSILKYSCSSCAFCHYNGLHVKEHQ